MTTIAWDGKQLASDSRATYSDGSIVHVRKVWKVRPGWKLADLQSPDELLLGATGKIGFGPLLKSWLEADGPEGMPVSDCSDALIITSARRILVTGGAFVDIIHPFVAIGSGQKVAMGAMAAGATAFEAIAHAAMWDDGTGGPIQSVSF